MCRPVEMGRCDGGVYILQTWIDGQDAEEAVPRLSQAAQYALGLEAGKILQKIHSLPAPEGLPAWEERFNRKIDRKISAYNACAIKCENGAAFLRCIEENRRLLENRPQCFQHGDYHTGNMMLADGQIVIIDFDRWDFGDPWEEFNRVVWCAQLAPPFARGMVDGYFNGEIPVEFWRLLALYIASNAISSIPWAIPFGEGEIKTMQAQTKQVLEWYGNMTRSVPQWYGRWKS